MAPTSGTFVGGALPEAGNDRIRLTVGVAAVVLATSIVLLPPLYAFALVGVLSLTAIGIAKPTWALALVFVAIPFELIVVNVGPVALTAVQLVDLFVVGLMLTEMLATGRWAIPKTPLDVPIFVWSASLFLGAIGALDPAATVKKAGITVVFAALYYLVVAKVRRVETISLLMKTLVASCTVAGAYGIWIGYRYLATGLGAGKGIIVGSEGLTVPRVASTVNTPVLLGGLMVIAIPLAIVLVVTTHKWQRFLAVLASATLFVALGFTFTRGAWLGALAALVVLLFERRTRNVLMVVFALLLTLSPAVVINRAATSTHVQNADIAHRFDYWNGALLMVSAHPIFGVGSDNFADNFARLPVPQTATRVAFHAHNIVLALLSETGIVGLFSFGAVFLGVMVLLLRHRSKDTSEERRLWRLAIAASIVGAFAQQMTHSFLLAPTVNSILWIFGGLAVVMAFGLVEAEDDVAVGLQNPT